MIEVVYLAVPAFFLLAVPVLIVVLAFAIAKGAHPWTWLFIRHVRYYYLAHLVLNTHSAGHIMGRQYRHIHQQTQADLDYLDAVWHGRL